MVRTLIFQEATSLKDDERELFGIVQTATLTLLRGGLISVIMFVAPGGTRASAAA